jgi:hypothetical protein
VALALRGWTPDAFARAKPEFMDAIRFGLLAERAAPMLARYREVQAMKIDPRDKSLDVPAILAAKEEAARMIPLLTEILYPADDDGG